MDTRKPGYPTNPVRSGETKTQYLDRVRSEKGSGSSSGGSRSGRGGDRDTSPSKPVRVMPGKTPMRVTGGMGSSSSSDRSEKMRAASEKAASQKESQMKMQAAAAKAASQKESQMKMRAASAKASEMKARTMGGASSKMGPGSVRTGSPVMRAKGGMVKGKK
jgi:hypothetical protein